MSHDIYFSSSRSGQRFDASAFDTYVQHHPWLSWRDDTSETHTEVEYRHPNTEVTFTYERFEVSPDSTRWPVVMTIEYGKPHVFGLEAAKELARFAGHFGLSVIDPQGDAARPLPFDPEPFLTSYDAGNRAGYSTRIANRSDHSSPLRTLPFETIERTWRWNFEIEDDTEPFAPCVSYVEVFGTPQVAVVWPETPEFILPEVDLVLVWRGRNRKSRLAPMTELSVALRDEPRADRALEARHVTVSEELCHAVEQLPLYDGAVTHLDLGELLDREWC